MQAIAQIPVCSVSEMQGYDNESRPGAAARAEQCLDCIMIMKLACCTRFLMLNLAFWLPSPYKPLNAGASRQERNPLPFPHCEGASEWSRSGRNE